MKRRRFLAWFGLAPLAGAEGPCPIGILVDKGPSVEITIPSCTKELLVGIASEFFGRGPSGAKLSAADQQRNIEKIAGVMQGSKEITLIITTKCPKRF